MSSTTTTLTISGVTASGYEPGSTNVPNNVLDNNLTTRWSAEGATQWIQADIGSATKTIAGVGIAWHKGDLRKGKFNVVTSTDGSTWSSPIFSTDQLSSGTSLAIEQYKFPTAITNTTRRYVRILCKGNTIDLWNSITELRVYSSIGGTTTPPPPTPTTGQDKHGIKKIYPDAPSDKYLDWFMNMTDPTSDSRFKNLTRANLRKESDGSWSATGESGSRQVRLEGWSPSGSKKFLNTEITVYCQYMSDFSDADQGSYAYQLYSRGGHHGDSGDGPCEGSAYKGRIRKDKGSAIVKEVCHSAYTSPRTGTALSQTIKGRWLGFKTVIYNISNGRVKIEVWVDENVQDSSGNLVIKNNWVKKCETIDSGGWYADESAFNSDCDGCGRDRDEILTSPGGTSSGNLVAYRTDGIKSKIKYFSGREITPPSV